MTARPADRHTVLALLVIAAALALRFYHLDAQSLWYDEGTSVALSSRSLAQIAANAADDIHPPLYYWLLAIWTDAFGRGVLAMRALSALLGTAIVAGVIILGRRLWDTRVALTAGLLAATSPYLVWYGQEVRMYTLAGLLAVATVGVTLALVPGPSPAGHLLPPRPPRLRSWLLYLLLATASLYTHYFVGASVVVIANAVALLTIFRIRLAGQAALTWLVRWLAVQLVVAALFLPWLAYAWSTVRHWPATSEPFGLAFALSQAVVALTAGVKTPPGASAWWPLAAAVAAIGALNRGRREGHWPGAVALTWAATPPVLLWILALNRPGWSPKHLMAAAPALDLLLAAGVAAVGGLVAGLAPPGSSPAAARRLGQLVALTLLAALLWPRAVALRAMYTDPVYQRDDYRGIARDIAAAAGADDAVILDAPTQIEVFGYYDRGAHPTYPLPLGWPPEREQVWAQLDLIGARHQDLYAVLWATDERDPEGLVESWLNAHRYKAFDRWYGNVRLALWAAPNGPLQPAWPNPREAVHFGDELALTLAHGPLVVAAGDVLALEARWQALARPAADYTVFVQLLDGEGIIAQRDMRPVGGTALTSTWQPPGGPEEARVVVDRIGLPVGRDVPPGRYRLIIGLYDQTTGRRLPVTAAPAGTTTLPDAYLVGSVQVR